MSDEVIKAIADLNKGFDEFKKTNDERLKQIETKGAADVVTEEKLAKIEADIAAFQKIADEAVLESKRQSRVVTDTNGNAIDLDAKAQEWADVVAVAYEKRPFDMDAKALDAYKAASLHYLRKGVDALEADERKALSVGGDPTGGYVVSPDTSGRIVKKVFETSPMRAYASIQAISTDALEGLFDLNEAGYGWVSETGSRAQTTTPDLGKWSIPVHEMYANPAATQKILDDASIDIEAWLAEKVSDRFSRAENAAFVSGTGVGQPRGFLTYPTGTTLPGQIEQLPTGVSADFAAAPAGGDAMIDMITALKAPYRTNANWFANRATQGKMRKLKDSDGRYIWQQSMVVGQPSSLFGFPVVTFDDMPAVAASSLSVAFGDMRAAYQIVDRIGIRTLRDPYTAKPYVLFYSTKRVGGDVVNFEAIKLLRFNT